MCFFDVVDFKYSYDDECLWGVHVLKISTLSRPYWISLTLNITFLYIRSELPASYRKKWILLSIWIVLYKQYFPGTLVSFRYWCTRGWNNMARFSEFPTMSTLFVLSTLAFLTSVWSSFTDDKYYWLLSVSHWGWVSGDTSCNNDVVITSKRRHFDVITSKWRRFDVITTLLLRHVFNGVSPYGVMEPYQCWIK